MKTWIEIIQRRNELLQASDWLVMRYRDEIDLGVETSISVQKYFLLLEYRQKLRDIPQENKDADKVEFPKFVVHRNARAF